MADIQQRPRPAWRRLIWPIKALLGVVCILAGIVMLFTPGPGWAAIIAGILLVAPESRLARWIRQQLHRIRDKVRLRRPRHDRHQDRPLG